MRTLKENTKSIIRIIYSVFVLLFATAHLLKDVIKHQYMKFTSNQRKDKILILGNGPSLKDVDLLSASNDGLKVCCVNFFPLKHKELFFNNKPRFICLMDPEFFECKRESLRNDIYDLYTIISKVDWDMTVIVPKGRKLPVDNVCISYMWISTYKPKHNLDKKIGNFMYSHNMATIGAQNVVIGAIFYFVASGYREIYLAGIDMSEFKSIYVDENNQKYCMSSHSYGEKKIYYSNEWIDLADILSAYCRMFLELRCAAKYAQDMKIPVSNISVGSYVDSFEKKSVYQKQHNRLMSD